MKSSREHFSYFVTVFYLSVRCLLLVSSTAVISINIDIITGQFS